MLLCLDVGNSHIYAGLFDGAKICLRFRYPSQQPCTSDTLGVFLTAVIEKNGHQLQDVSGVCLCSVAPALDYSVISACRKYLSLTPFMLKPGVKTGLNIAVQNPAELGADRIADAVAALTQFPNRHLVVVDFGTATTVCAITKKRVYLGGAILPGIKLSMNSLSSNTAQLSDVDIVAPSVALGKTTATNIQSGLYFGQLGAIKEIVHRIQQEVFESEAPMIISTGGYGHLFANTQFFDVHVPDLVLHGLRLVWEKNQTPATD